MLIQIFLAGCGDSERPDTIPPVITLNGDSSITVYLNETYNELGANAIDDSDGIVEVVMSGTVDTSVFGSYTITYSATDSAANYSSVTRSIIVVAKPSTKPFITLWKTDNPGGYSNDNQIMISTSGVGYDYQVDWGDGAIDEHITGDITHTYATAGTYTVKISGSFPQVYFSEPSYDHREQPTYLTDNLKLLSIEQWGTNKWRSMHRAFAECKYLVVNATDIPDLTEVTDMSFMFYGAEAFNQELNDWDVSNVQNMAGTFAYATTFNQDLSHWDVSSVTDMSGMFLAASDFNQDISSWDVSSVINMRGMFYVASSFNQDLSTWNVSKVTDMRQMFSASSFNQDISRWDVSNVSDMHRMFAVTPFNQDLSSWDVSNVQNMSGTFAYATTFNQDLSLWDVSSVADMGGMFVGASNFNQDLSVWDVSNVTNMSLMFASTAFNQDISSWDVSNVKKMSSMFHGVTLTTQNYDALIIGWSGLSLQSNVDFSGGSSKYSNSAQDARMVLTEVFGWTITDGGVED
ncbi:BspA family leucine-rich repeat surface protein [Catenovulum agarivorans]|uniref:BspA family leucine-rich repeat surface protein n=1 Tax=Catenovulum agarivorans TaxID=1172192 RepID=UPI0002F552DA|nr:BspA family leucine-rich repeat surface protein [Catenovulum agarivorans]